MPKEWQFGATDPTLVCVEAYASFFGSLHDGSQIMIMLRSALAVDNNVVCNTGDAWEVAKRLVYLSLKDILSTD